LAGLVVVVVIVAVAFGSKTDSAFAFWEGGVVVTSWFCVGAFAFSGLLAVDSPAGPATLELSGPAATSALRPSSIPFSVSVAAFIRPFFKLRSTCPKSRSGSITFRTRDLSSFVSGKPVSVVRSQIFVSWIEISVFDIWGLDGDGDGVVGCGEAVKSVMVKMPPDEGIRETSPRVVEKVWRSSWAYYSVCERLDVERDARAC
jgi:hypothetical protein